MDRQPALIGGFVCLCVAVAGLAAGTIPPTERDALIALYNGTNGAGWVASDNWLGDEGTECTWYGVACSGDGNHVTELDLRGNQLNGTIPSALGDLTELVALSLESNQLSGTIPAEFVRLTRLMDLELGMNQLSGPIPSGLGNLQNLGHLGLEENQLTGSIPSTLGGLAKLQYLQLSSNGLSGTIPPELGNLGSLTDLGLLDNQLSGTIPDSLGSLVNLVWMGLERNALSGTIPSALGNLVLLYELALGENQLTGTIPPQLGQLGQLEGLFLDNNNLSGMIPAAVLDLPELTHLGLGTNRLTGTVPTQFANRAGLQQLTIHENLFTGSIPPQLGDLVNLELLALSDNNLSGTIPPELGSLTTLALLFLGHDNLAGEIPRELINLTRLEHDGLDLCGNSLYTEDGELRDFLNTKQVGGDWEGCQESAAEPGPEIQVSTPGAVVGLDTGAAVDASGNRVIAWQQSGGEAKALAGNIAVSQDADGIFARLFDADGNAVGETLEVDTVTEGELSEPAVSFSATGDFVVVWHGTSTTKQGTADGIFARLYGWDLEPTTEAFQLDDGTAVTDAPQVTTSAAGDFVAVWRTGGEGKALQGSGEIFARFFLPDGTAKTDPIEIDFGDPDEVSEPDVAVDAAGNAVVVWQQRVIGKQNGVDGIFARFFAPEGSSLGGPVEVNVDPVTDTTSPRVSADAVGDAVVVWAQPEVAKQGGWDIFARLVDADGEPEGSPFPVNSSTAGDQFNAAVASNPAGDFAVAWESTSTTKQDGADAVFARFFDSQGNPLGPDYEVVTAEGDHVPVSPEVVLANDDRVTVAYTKTLGGEVGEGVFFRYVDVEGQPSTCEEDSDTLCLNQDRFEVEVTWRAADDANGVGQAVALTDDTGYFWYFDPANVEMIVKVLDAIAINGHYWVFYGSLSNVEFSITVTDTSTGGSVTYYNPQANFASVGDTEAIPGGGMKGMIRFVEVPGTMDPGVLDLYTRLMAAGPRRGGTKTLADCTPGQTNLCLNQSRFKIEVSWEGYDGSSGDGQAVPLSSDTGYFWFFTDSNVELVVKVLDGRWLNDHFWVFYGALSDVPYTITVTDTETGAVKTYVNPAHNFASEGDVYAFEVP